MAYPAWVPYAYYGIFVILLSIISFTLKKYSAELSAQGKSLKRASNDKPLEEMPINKQGDEEDNTNSPAVSPVIDDELSSPGSGKEMSPSRNNLAFEKFQKNYLAVYLIMMAADWFQGPYMYDLYDSYGFQMNQIGTLFIMGFGSSMVSGPIVGSAADKL
jgi:hypothetical protein